MTLSRVLPPAVAKEIRALLPAWLASMAVVGAAGALGDSLIRSLGMVTYGVASVALGAMSIGHEYTLRTLPLLLSQPSRRARVFVTKLSVLAVMLLTLAGVAWGRVLHPSSGNATFVLTVLCGLFVAPWLTIRCRNPLAGTVFTIPIPGWLWLFVGVFVEGPLKLVVFRRGMLGLCAIAAVLGWRTFMRLEAIEGPDADLQLPWARPATTAPARDRHAIWLLMKKELALQQLSLALAVLYCAGWLALVASGKMQPGAGEHTMDVFGGLTILYGAMLALLIGSLASAEERQLGTLEWQVLLPMASWKQWVVKAAMAIGLAMVLGVGLPALLLFVSGGAIGLNGWFVLGILVLTVGSLYVSSLCANGLQAFLLSLAVAVILILVIPWTVTPRVLSSAVLLVPLSALVALVLWLALENHRSAERGAWLLRWLR